MLNQHNTILKVEQRLFQVSFILVAITLPFSSALNSIAIIFFSLCTIFLYRKYSSINMAFAKYSIVMLLFTIVFIVGFINTSNFNSAFRLFETRSSLVIFPVMLILGSGFWTKSVLRNVLVGFAFTTIMAGLIIQGWLLYDLIDQGKMISDFFYWRVSGSDLSERIGIHPTYLSMYAIFSIGIIYEFYIVKKSSFIKLFAASISIIYLTVLTLHLASRISFVVLLAVLIVLLLSLIWQYGKSLTIAIVPILIIGIWVYSLDGFAIKSRFENNIGLEVGILTGNKLPDSSKGHDQRTFAWYSSARLIKENLFFGVGSGDVMDALNSIFVELGAQELALKKLNSHNQFFDAIIRNGIGGFISLIVLYLYPVFEVKVKRLYLIFALIIILTSLTENILERQKGTVFFGVFSCLLFAYYKADGLADNITNSGDESEIKPLHPTCII